MALWQPPADDAAQLEYQAQALRGPGQKLNSLWGKDATAAADALHRAWAGGTAAYQAQVRAAFVQQYLGTTAAGLFATDILPVVGALGDVYGAYGGILGDAQHEVREQTAGYRAGAFDAPNVEAANRRTRENYEYRAERLVYGRLRPLVDSLIGQPREENPYQRVEPTHVDILPAEVRAVADSYDKLVEAIEEAVGGAGLEYLPVPSEDLLGLGYLFDTAGKALRFQAKMAVTGFTDLAAALRAACDAYTKAESIGADYFTKERMEYEAFKEAIDHPVRATAD